MSDSRLQRLQAAAAAAAGAPERAAPARREKIKAEVLVRAQAQVRVATSRDPPLAGDPATGADAQIALRQEMRKLALQRRRQEEEQSKKAVLQEPPEEDSKSDDQDDEGEEERTPLLRPIFVPKGMRQAASGAQHEGVQDSREGEERSSAHELLVQFVRREYEEERAGDATSAGGGAEAVDDTDGLEEEEEAAAWRLRELLRMRREREARERVERDKMEMERVRNMSEEERRQMDEEKTREWMAQPREQMRFMQKYYHKGAFFMDPEERLLQRDYQQATGEDAAANRELLPEVKQVRDFGKKGRTKWTHLVAEDTTAFDYGWGHRKNAANYQLVSKMGGMRGHLDNPAAKRPKP